MSAYKQLPFFSENLPKYFVIDKSDEKSLEANNFFVFES